MVRSAAAAVAIMILPAFSLAQEIPASHTVVDGDTLWDLAQEYYSNPFDWRRIWEANQDEIADPNLILPGQVLVIPDGTAAVTEVVVEGPEDPAPEPPSGPNLAEARTIFYRETSVVSGGVVRGDEIEYFSVPRDLVYSAPRLIGLEGDPDNNGTIAGHAGGTESGETLRAWDRIRLDVQGTEARVGDRFQLFTVSRSIEDVGQVVLPTGVATVTDVTSEAVVAVVDKEFHRITIGDFIGPIPSYGLERGQMAQDVMGGSAAMVMGGARGSGLQDLNDVVFLDLGRMDGIGLGDEFDLLNPAAGAGVVEGVLQVVGVSEETSAARIINMVDAVFSQGVVVRLARKMR